MPMKEHEEIGARRKGIESRDDPVLREIGAAFVLVGVGFVILGLGVFGYQSLSWLHVHV
jgi:hypothetical protein